MSTIVNTPGSDNSGSGVVVGVLLVVLIVILLAVFGLPYLRDRGTPAPETSGANINVTVPTGSTGGSATE